MKTKYGEIKTLQDLFEKISGSEKWENPTVGIDSHLKITTEEYKCKICGEIVRNYTDYSAIYDDQFRGKSKHLDFHKELNQIGIKIEV